MGVIVRTEPDGKKFMEGYPQFRQMLQQVQWLQFVEKINGYDKEVTKSFSREFDGVEAEIGDVKIVVTKYFMEEVSRLPRVGERWFKNRGIEENEWRTFLKNPCMDTSVFKKGIPSTNLKGKWRNLLLVILKFITCEGRFNNIFFLSYTFDDAFP